ncbi:MAG TPA: molybdopterin cofactor-binding domain-containing protein [bacterium]|nr:molybdopterin cofactor-binding domain-containing protein [bacterium]
MSKFKNIGTSQEKIDSLSLATGSSKFVDDFQFNDALQIAFLYSPHAHAIIKKLDASPALEMDGVVDVFYYDNVEQNLHTTAGQGFPEPSPYDALIFDNKVRYVGDRVAAVLAENKQIAERAANKIDVEYEKLDPIFDSEKALEPGAPLLHDKDKAYMPIPVPYDPDKNLAAKVKLEFGDLEKSKEESDYTFDHTYETQYASHCAMEPHGVASYFDEMRRLVIITSTQVPFHARRIVARALDFPIAKIRVIKPRIGGGFGGKQEVFLEQVAALATIKHKKPVKIVLTRPEVFQSSRTRHPIKVKLDMGANKNGEITYLDMHALLNSGGYGAHALTIISNTGSKVLPFLNKIKNMKFVGESAYTNLPVGGAYRGYGATQGYFALNQHLDMIARKLGIDLLDFIKKIHIKTGETSRVFEILGEGTEGVSQKIGSCQLEECIDQGAQAIDWYNKRKKRIKNNHKVRGVGVAVAMQGSGIPQVDMGSAFMKINDDGSFNLDIGATDLGTGSDTILAQIAAEVLNIDLSDIIVLSSDTDRTPFDVGAYASSTTYVSGKAVEKCALKVKKQILIVGSKLLECDSEELKLENGRVINTSNHETKTFGEIARHALYSADQFQIQASASNVPQQSPPPFIAQFAEVEIDQETGQIEVLEFVSAVDCGQAINPKLAEGQVEGAAVNGISYALTEEYKFSSKGHLKNKNFRDYKIFTAADMPKMETILVESYEDSGPFGAKSVGEIGINGPLPAIANAIYDAVGIRLYNPPFTASKIYGKMQERGKLDN